MGNRWSNIKPLINQNVVSELESSYKIQICDEFKEFIKVYNGGKLNPMPYIWDHRKYVGYTVSRILSFNESDNHNVFEIIGEMKNLTSIPFSMCKEMDKVFTIRENSVYVVNVKTGEENKLFADFSYFHMRVTI